MKIQDIEERIAEIRDKAHDDETAHINEDDLHQAVLQAIAESTLEDCTPATAARLALTTLGIVFARWCA